MREGREREKPEKVRRPRPPCARLSQSPCYRAFALWRNASPFRLARVEVSYGPGLRPTDERTRTWGPGTTSVVPFPKLASHLEIFHSRT